MIYVIGSGPAGITCAAALVARGREVTIVDAGIDIDPARRERVTALQRIDPAHWPSETIEEIRGSAAITAGGVPLKYVYGSDHPYREVDRLTPFDNRGTATRPTLARGGFSTVWGASVLPFVAADLADWPIGVAELEPHYRAVCSQLGLSAVRDDLEAWLPLYCDEPRPLRPSAQARAMMRDLEANREELQQAGFRCGYSRLAVRADDSAAGPGCVYCGLCLHGCPHELIHGTAATLARLLDDPRLHYRDGLVVRRLDETPDGVKITAVSRHDDTPHELRADRVYLGAGALATTRILLESLGAWDRPLPLQDSQYFLLPLLRRRAVADPRDERLHTLAQLFVELRCDSISAETVHLQLYTYNDLYRRALRRMLGPLERFASGVLSRLIVIQGYLHSRHSARMEATLTRDPAGGPPRLILTSQRDPAVVRRVRRVVSHLRRHRRSLGAFPVSPLLQVAPAGRGFHSGGSFPMRTRPGEFESDTLGRPTGFRRVHVVDAATFPSIPATTITLSVMANAHRIASSDE